MATVTTTIGTSSPTLYCGPSTTLYETLGTVPAGQSVTVYWKEDDGAGTYWYFIECAPSGGTLKRRGHVQASAFSNQSALSPVTSPTFYGKLCRTRSGVTTTTSGGPGTSSVYTQNATTLPAQSGVTLLLAAESSYQYAEYCTGGKKTIRAYIPTANLETAYAGNLGRIGSSSVATYLGPSTSSYYASNGSIGAREYVVVLASDPASSQNYDTRMSLVEFNTANGRKRGYIASSSLSSGVGTTGMPGKSALYGISSSLTVYSAPGTGNVTYSTTPTACKRVVALTNGAGFSDYTYIEYNISTSSGASARGYVQTSSLGSVITPSIASVSGLTAQLYGTSSGGRALNYYRIGTPSATRNNIFVAVFAQHSFEDAWPADSEGLTVIASQFIGYLNGSDFATLRNKWCMYVVQCANPDSLLSGFTNNGPGRATAGTNQRDMNRSWPLPPGVTTRTTYSDRRNYNKSASSSSTAAVLANDTACTTSTDPELKSLYNAITGWFNPSGVTVKNKLIIDCHGWLAGIYSDRGTSSQNSTFKSFFTDSSAFGSAVTSQSGGSQLLCSTGTNLIGAAGSGGTALTTMIEFPVPTYPGTADWSSFATKFKTAIYNALSSTTLFP